MSQFGTTGISFAMAAMLCPAETLAGEPQQTGTLHQIAAPYVRPPGAPEPADVCFSSRWKHPRNPDDPHDSFKAAAAFHATRFVWVYTTDSAFIAKAKNLGCAFQCAVNSMIPDQPGGGRKKGRITDLDGNLVSAPWMRSWKSNAWGCVNAPDWRKSYLAYAKKCLDAGTDTLQMDDPPCNYAAVNWGGCFCDHCIAGFRSYLEKNTTPAQRSALGIDDLAAFDYRAFLKAANAPVGDAFAKYDGGLLKKHFVEFQKASVQSFYAFVRREIDNHAGKPVPISSNNYDGRWSFPYDLFDFGTAELPHRSAKPALLYQKFLDARKRGKAQVFTFVSEDIALTRKVIATAYASGGHLIVPWDVYMGAKPRYFGKPADYADLYKFVRDNAALFNDYQDAAVLIPGFKDPRFTASPPMTVTDNPDLAVFARAIPQNPNTAIVIHLVDWAAKPAPAKLHLHGPRFFDRPVHATFLRPGQNKQPLATDRSQDRITIQIPPLTPWALLVLQPEKTP